MYDNLTMIRRFTVAALLFSGLLHGQAKTGKAPADRYNFRQLMQQIWDGWGTLNPANTAKFYSKDADRTFFDITPLKYRGWNEYEAGVKKSLADYSSAKFTLYSDQHVVQRGKVAWATSTGHATLTRKSGGKEDMDFRWTVLWENIENNWLIVHEHVSVPLGQSAAASPGLSLPTKKKQQP
jgi:ketosteroid isomerase-like protein